jgi:predicted RNase H-like nuclease (RuvC/YqgF family)
MLWGGLVCLFFSVPVATASSLENLAKSLARIRGEVETLQTQLDLEKEKHASKMSALNSQLADLSVEERRQKMSIEKLQYSIDKMTESAKKTEQSGENLKPVLLAVLNDYKRHIQTGFPFKMEDRIKAIEDLENNIANHLVDPNKAVNQAWSLIEDEIRLSKENGIYQQTIPLGGERILVDIAKLGTVFLFFQTRDGRVGMAKRAADGGWIFETVDNTGDAERIRNLFDSLKKQIRQGYFELPNPLRK